jgi:hypothetical protein
VIRDSSRIEREGEFRRARKLLPVERREREREREREKEGGEEGGKEI